MQGRPEATNTRVSHTTKASCDSRLMRMQSMEGVCGESVYD